MGVPEPNVDPRQPAPALDAVPIPLDEVLAEYFQGDVLVCHPAGPRVAVLNATGADVWVLIDGQRSIREIAAAIAAAYGVDLLRCESDVAAFVGTLLRRALVRLQSEPPGIGAPSQ